MKISNFQKNLKTLIIFISEDCISGKKVDPRLIFRHYCKIDKTIKKIINTFLYIFFSIIKIVSLSNFFELSKTKKIFFLKFITKFPFIGEKINELFCALILIHFYNNEKIFNNVKKNSNLKNNFEFIIIGSGPGGSVTALEIIKKKKDVMIIEEGSSYSDAHTKHPGNEFIMKWRDGGVNSSILGTQINFSSGKSLGGGSEINSGLFHLPDERFIDDWKKKFETEDFDYQEIKKYSREISEYFNLSDEQNFENDVNPDKFLEGSKKLNFKIEKIKKLKIIQNGKELKLSMKNTYIKEYLKKGGEILQNSFVESVNRKNKLWEIKIISKKKTKFFYCKYLFLCCGSIYTNQLLQKSNLLGKSKDKLDFKLHPMIKVIVDYEEKVQSLNNDVHQYQVTEFYPKYILGNASSSPQFILNNFTKDKKNFSYIKNNFQNLSVYHATFSFGEGNIKKLYNGYNFIRYKISNENLSVIKESLINLCKVLFEGGGRKIILLKKGYPHLNKNNFITIINSIKKINDLKFSSVHILGGVSMGESKNALSNSYGKLKLLENIFVNDSSLINTNLLKNPQGIVMTIALRNIRKFFEKYYENN